MRLRKWIHYTMYRLLVLIYIIPLVFRLNLHPRVREAPRKHLKFRRKCHSHIVLGLHSPHLELSQISRWPNRLFRWRPPTEEIRGKTQFSQREAGARQTNTVRPRGLSFYMSSKQLRFSFRSTLHSNKSLSAAVCPAICCIITI